MALKGWKLGMGNTDEKREAETHEPTLGLHAGERGRVAESEHLGPYQVLIAAIRDELEQFVTSQLRLHLAIAERDRYVLASIEVECDGSEEECELLRRFTREFKPEQIKHYLAKEVIAGLRNAGAIDLSQFAGLNAESEGEGAAGDQERYGELIAELASGAPRAAARPYRVTLVGRWSELEPSHAIAGKGAGREGPRTPISARALTVAIEDAAGTHSMELASVVPGRRYAVGRGEDCDIVVDGVYASRRHCEVWFDKGAWWVADTGSTNGIRVEDGDRVAARSQAEGARASAIALAPGAWLVLAAHTQGEAREYPRLSLRAVDAPAAAKQAGMPQAAPSTPITPIASGRHTSAWIITTHMSSGSREVEVAAAALPFRIGRSRNQALVIDWAHAEVSGRHLEIVALDDAGATVVVHGDNGVTVDGTLHGTGNEFCWAPGQTLCLGEGSACTLTLSRNA